MGHPPGQGAGQPAITHRQEEVEEEDGYTEVKTLEGWQGGMERGEGGREEGEGGEGREGRGGREEGGRERGRKSMIFIQHNLLYMQTAHSSTYQFSSFDHPQ